jgi:hypothetical protein
MPSLDGFRERRRGRFGAVLLATFATILVTVALPEPEDDWGAVLLAGMQGGTLWLAFLAAGTSRRLVEVGLVVWVMATAVIGLASTTSSSVPEPVAPFVSLLLIAAAAAAILRHLVAKGKITLASVGGVLTVYLMIGLFFTYVYATVGKVTDEAPLKGEGPIDLSAEVYFSFVTLATVGYGDLTPASDLVRGLAITQALLGQLYLVSLVALVISNLGRERPERPPRSIDDD